MAETIAGGHYIEHTAAADGAGVTTPYYVKSIIWHGFTNAAHTLQVKDGNGTIIIPEIACGAAATVIGIITLPVERMFNGIETDVLGSGTVVYLLG